MDPIVIIGSGLAGYNLARNFRNLDKQTPVVMLTADEGRFYSKPLLSTAYSHNKTIDDLTLHPAEVMAQNLNLQILNNTVVTKIDPNTNTVFYADKSLKYSKLVLALGAKLRSLNIDIGPGTPVISVNDIAAYNNLQQMLQNKTKVAILGSGLVGCEFANDLLKAGLEVEVITVDAYPMPNILPQAAGNAVATALQQAGVKWHFNSELTKISKNESKCMLTLASGTTITADLLLSAIGISPNLDLAKAAGIKTNVGICTDAYLATNYPDVYALGDCAEIAGHALQYIMPLMNASRALAKTLHGEKTAVHYPAMPVTAKVTVCPLRACPPPVNATGTWEITAAGIDVTAKFIDSNAKLQGFALTGADVSKCHELVKTLPALLA